MFWVLVILLSSLIFFFQAEDGIRDSSVTGVQTCALPISPSSMPVDLSHAASISVVGTAGIAAVTFIVLGLALLTSSVDRRFAAGKLQRTAADLTGAQRLRTTGRFGWEPPARRTRWSDDTVR